MSNLLTLKDEYVTEISEKHFATIKSQWIEKK